jgi:addiction module HigA family antidote
MDHVPHPGGFLRTELIEPLGHSETALAEISGVTRPALSALFNDRADFSPEMPIRLEKAFGISMERLIRMQNNFDIAEARKRVESIDVTPYSGKRPQRNLTS